MPVYEYQCNACGKTHEAMQKFTDAPLTVCPHCGGLLKKLISHTSFVLKGSGWYVTDYASGDRKKAIDSEKPQTVAASSDTKTDAKTETKSESKTESKSDATSGPKDSPSSSSSS